MKPITKIESIVAWLALAIIFGAIGFLMFFGGAGPAYFGGFSVLFFVIVLLVVPRERLLRMTRKIESWFVKEPKDDPSEPARFV